MKIIFRSGVVGMSGWLMIAQTAAFAQTGAAGSKGPPLPPVIFGAEAVDLTLQRATEEAHEAWRKNDGGMEFASSLKYGADSKPILMLVTDPEEKPDKQLRRQKAMVAACEFLLDGAAFPEALICVVEFDLRKPERVPKTRNTGTKRELFNEAVRKAGKTQDVKDAFKQAKSDDAAVRQICKDLGFQ